MWCSGVPSHTVQQQLGIMYGYHTLPSSVCGKVKPNEYYMFLVLDLQYHTKSKRIARRSRPRVCSDGSLADLDGQRSLCQSAIS